MVNLNIIPELYWIKSHSGIGSNEYVDRMAKEQAKEMIDQYELNNNKELGNELNINTYIDKRINQQITKDWQKRHELEEKDDYMNSIIDIPDNNMVLIYNNLERQDIMKLTRLITGNNNLNRF